MPVPGFSCPLQPTEVRGTPPASTSGSNREIMTSMFRSDTVINLCGWLPITGIVVAWRRIRVVLSSSRGDGRTIFTLVIRMVPLTCGVARRYLSKHLVFVKAVRFRHYPVTVNAERSALRWKPLGLSVPGRLSDLDDAQVRRPARCQPGLIQLRWESWRAWTRDSHCGSRGGCLRITSRFVCLAERGRAKHACRFGSGNYARPGRRP